MDTAFRPLETLDDYRACVALQRETWGAEFGDCVPPAILMVSQKMGGIAAGGFEPSGTLVGFVFGLTGWRAGRPCHWSHMLAVGRDARDRGIGRRLKAYQRTLARAQGISLMYWTFDPLVARNAHLNMARLGVQVQEYVADMYGADEGSITDSVIGSDRFVVQWGLAERDDRGAATPADTRNLPAAVRCDESRGQIPVLDRIPEHPAVRVEIPRDIQALKLAAPDVARAWRATTRQVLETYLTRGYRVTGFHRDPHGGPGHYVLTSQEHPKEVD